MNVKCLICSDLFTPTQDIFVTPCGHLFHYSCLIQWIERSRTCPQCRSRTTEKSIHRVYLSIEENVETVDPNTLQNIVDNVKFQLKMTEMQVKTVQDQFDTEKVKVVGLREEIATNENKLRVLESAMYALKEQLNYFKSKAKECEKLEQEVRKLKDRIRDMEQVEMVITGSLDEVDDMLRNNSDSHSLSVLVSTLKKELIDSDRKKKQIQMKLKDAQNDLMRYKLELDQIKVNNNKLQQNAEAHKNCEKERLYLKQKISQLAANNSIDNVNTSIKRIITESPMPLPKKDSKNTSMSLPEKVCEIKDSDSPYLKVQECSIALSGIINYNTKYKSVSSNRSNLNKFSMMKKSAASSSDTKICSEVSYDGFGGHSREETFPTPRPPKIGLKRHKSSTITQSKFRKLAPTSKKTVGDFFRDST